MKIIAFRFGIIILGIAIISVVTSCRQNSSHASSSRNSEAPASEAGALKEQMMTLHEDAMEKIAPLRRIEDSIHGEINRIAAEKGDTRELSQILDELNHCDTAMFGWMGRYHDQTMSRDSANTALIKQQLQSLKRLNASMESVIGRGRSLLH